MQFCHLPTVSEVTIVWHYSNLIIYFVIIFIIIIIDVVLCFVALFSTILLDTVPVESLQSWTACNRGCFVLVRYFTYLFSISLFTDQYCFVS